MKKRIPALLILLMFATTQLLGTFFQFTIFEIERQEKPDFSKQTSESLSLYRDTQIPLILLPIAFVIVLNLYLFLFKFSLIIKIAKLSIYIFSIMCFVLITQIIGAYILTPFLQVVNFFLSLIIPAILLLTGRLRSHINNALGMSLCAITGSALASYFTIEKIVILLAIISFFDYYFVIRTKQIPRIVEIFEKNEIPLALGYSANGAEYQLGFGDLIFATGITVAFFIDSDIFAAFRTIILTTASLMAFMLILEKKGDNKPYPAVPAIFVGGLASVILGLLS